MDYYTIKGNRSLKDVFLAMLDTYIKAVRNRHLPNYFIRLVVIKRR